MAVDAVPDITPEELDARIATGTATDPVDLRGVTVKGYAPVLYAVYAWDTGALDALLSERCVVDVNAAARGTGFTAAHFAASNGDAATLSTLLAHGPDLAAATHDRVVWSGVYASAGETPLHLAADKGSREACEALVAAGAAVDAVDACGNTPRDTAWLRHGDGRLDDVVAAGSGVAPPPDFAATAGTLRDKKRADQAAIAARLEAAVDADVAAFCEAVAATAPPPLAADTVAVVIVPGKGCTRKAVLRTSWYAGVARAARAWGLRVVVPGLNAPEMPAPMTCNERLWVPAIASLCAASPPAATVLVGHSTGGDAVMRLLESATAPVMGAVVVSAGPVPDSDDDDAGMDDAARAAKAVAQRDVGYYDRPWDWKRVRAGASGFFDHFHGQDDAIVPVAEGRRIAAAVESEYHEVPDGGHFMDATFPLLLATLKQRLRL